MDPTTRTYRGLELRFAPLRVGFLKAHKDLMKRVGAQANSFDGMVEMMPLIYTSAREAMGDAYPGDEAIDDAIDLVQFNDAVLAVLEASGFAMRAVPAGEADPVER